MPADDYGTMIGERDFELDTTPIDEEFLKSYGWRAYGNTYYPPESSHAKQYDQPILCWIRVDGTIRLLGGNQWSSEQDITQARLFEICKALNIKLEKVKSNARM